MLGSGLTVAAVEVDRHRVGVAVVQTWVAQTLTNADAEVVRLAAAVGKPAVVVEVVHSGVEGVAAWDAADIEKEEAAAVEAGMTGADVGAAAVGMAVAAEVEVDTDVADAVHEEEAEHEQVHPPQHSPCL